MKINVDVYRKGEEKPFTTIYGVEEIYLDPDHSDMVVYSYGLVNYLKKPFEISLVFHIVNDDNSEID